MDKGKRITGAARDKLAAEIMKEYEGGASIRAIAASLGRSYGFVHGILVEGGAILRDRGGNTRRQAGM
ncbi:helix-turn-helix domain-containing protein [Streptomyces sp. NPDC090442]|uniref:helix-turn-helix domain-containing protein n=1 Tax=Streptomyces sp. NPDC090442 TaxID=3365962 RepID=UPI0038028735